MPQIRVVFLLLQEEPLRMSDMSASLDVSMSRVTGLIDKLVERELVIRWTDQYDRRSVLCCLTEAGKELGGRLLAERRFRWEERLNHLNVSELKKFCQAMELVLNANRIPTERNESRALESVSR
jgi:DNA-binding MarR family transcriptional regulator